MQTFAMRAGRWPLALTFAALALGACANDEPVAPTNPSTKANLAAQWDTSVTAVVTNTSGGTDVGSLRWAADKMRLWGGKIVFDSALGGKTVTLDTGLFVFQNVEIIAPSKGVTISGKDQFRLIKANANLKLTNVTLTKGYNEFGSAIAGVNVTLDHSTVSGNRGGTAISIEKGITLVNSTVSGNSVQQPAIYYLNGSTVTIDNSTIAYNSPGAGIGMFGAPNQWAVGLMRNSIISNNGANGSPQENCNNLVGFTYQGTNISDDYSCGGVTMTVADPQLLPLANNGGPTMTHAIPHTSPAYNQGFACLQATDQRYITRDAKCDVGAFEFNDWTKVTIAIDPAVKVDATGKAALTGTVTCTRADAFRLTLELHQNQKVGKQVVDVHSVNDIPVTCGTTPTAWTAAMGLVPGETFQAGAARATAATFQTPDWVTPASTAGAVKISFARK